MSDSGDSAVSKKKSFSSRFSSKMDKFLKKGDHSDSESDDDSGSGSGKGKSSSLFGGKLHNPFKKGHGSDSDDDGRGSSKSPPKSRKSSSSDAAKPSVVPPMPSHFVLSPEKPEPSTDPVAAGLARGEAEVAVALTAPTPSSNPPAAATPGAAAAASPALPARAAPAAPTTAAPEAKAPSGTIDAALPTQPTRAAAAAPAAAAAAAAPAAPAAATDAATDAAAAAAPAPEPKKPRVTVGGPVFGAPEILLTGVKGDPDAVMKSLRARGFVVHLVRDGIGSSGAIGCNLDHECLVLTAS